MDRFLSKLDLRDIKIKPEGNEYLPHDEEPQFDENHRESDTEPEETPEETFDTSPDGSGDNHDTAIADDSASLDSDLQTDGPATATVDREESQHENEEYDDADPVDTEVLKVSAKSRPSAVAGAIAGVVRESGRAEVQAIGAGATNQAVKAVAIARDYLWESDLDAICLPEFIDVVIDDEERTAIRLVVELR